MNIKLIFILIIIIIIINLYENFIIKKELYNEDLLKTLINLDQQLNEICIKHKAIKGYEFSLKLSKNKVNNIRYMYGLSSDVPNYNQLDINVINELNLSSEFRKLIFNYLKKNNFKLKSIGYSEDQAINAERVYFEIIDEIKKNIPTIISYEKINNNIFLRKYKYEYLREYLENQIKKSGRFGKIITKYIPLNNFESDGYTFKSSKVENIESIRVTLVEYLEVNDLSNMILELADYFNIEDMIEVKKWIYHFKNNEVNVIGITFSPKQNISFYTRELTEYITEIKYE